MTQAVVVDCVRTPIGRSHKKRGVYRQVRSDDLAAGVVRALVQRTGIAADEIDDLLFGAVQHHGEQGVNVARIISVLAGLPDHVGGVTINRLCGSSLQAINQASHAIIAGAENVQIAGGLEHMDHVGLETEFDVNPRYFESASRESLDMGVTSDQLATKHGVSRREQDEFAVRSHRRAVAAQERGDFDHEIVPTPGHDPRGNPMLVEQDQCPRPDTSLEQLERLRPAFVTDTGTVTAGNSSPVNDGAAAVLMMSDSRASELGLKPLARVVASAVIGVSPDEMGIGPIHATRKVLERAGMTLADIDLIELNEAFAAQAIVCVRGLGLDEEKMNVRGGALALGHPLGASGARISTTLIHAMRDRDATLGLATMCIGLGQGIATIYERLS
jgi:acetyl-CoA acyltransferase